MSNFIDYQRMTKELAEIRLRNNFKDSTEEDLHLDKMDEVFFKLTKQEIDVIRSMARIHR